MEIHLIEILIIVFSSACIGFIYGVLFSEESHKGYDDDEKKKHY